MTVARMIKLVDRVALSLMNVIVVVGLPFVAISVLAPSFHA